MGTTLTGTTPQDTYDSLIKVTDNGPLSGTAKYLSDGLGNDSALALSTGNIGIGTTSPSRNLHILGGAGVGTVLKLEAGSGAITYLQLAYNGATNAQSGYISYDSSANMGLFTNDTERMRITSAGNVGIGTSSPTGSYGKLTVAGTGITINADGSAKLEIGRYSAGVANSYIKLGSTSTSLRVTNAADQYDIVVIENNNTGEKLRVLESGGITFNGDTAAANALDDYEEGTWTPTISFGGASVGVTYAASRAGQYTKIGRQVTATAYILLTNKGTSTGAASIGGLPYVIGASSGFYSSACFSAISQLSYVGMLQGYGEINTNRIDLVETTEAGSQTNITDADFTNVSQVLVQFTYFV